MQPKTKSSSLEKESRGQEEPKSMKENIIEHPEQNTEFKKNVIVLGICAMKKKVGSKPMKEILSRLRCKEIEILEMWQYLEVNWKTWPKVDALICFHSDGFPYLMAWKYVQKHKPFLINDLDKQQLLWDRTAVYDLLKKIKVPVAKHYFVFRDFNYLDGILARGNGKYIQSPKSSQDKDKSPSPTLKQIKQIKSEDKGENEKPQRQKKTSLKSRSSLNENIAGFIKGQSLHKQQNPLTVIKQEGQFFEDNKVNTDIKAKKQQSRQQFETKFQVKSKGKHRYSELTFEAANYNSPSLLKTYCSKRHAERLIYDVEQNEDNLIIKYGDVVHKMKKPFVEKPFDSENHQICVYYPESMGGGRKKLFRKIKDVSSQYEQNQNCIRRDGNYIYEQFLPTNAFDIKVYTIGPYYMYAEARRSPTLDGVVSRNQDGKQMRYPVILTPDQKFICNRIVQEFGQEVCGFDLLRANGKSYVCDVNGWSFVKGNPKYWEDCSKILKKKIFTKFFPDKIHQHPLLERFYTNKQSENEYRPPLDNLSLKVQELRSIVSIFRHGDRSPKLKLKIKSSDPRFIEFFKDTVKDQIKFKDAKNLTKILQTTINIIAELNTSDPLLKDFLHMKLVLEEGGHFEGFTRKLQLKVVDRGQAPEGKAKGPIKKIMIVLKWGGELSYLGYQDAIELGKKMRMERYDDHDCLSLYSSYRHDLKTYSSDEGRCIKTAAAFLKGFLSIQGQLAPIISSMVKADEKAQRLLDCTSSQNHSVLADQLQQRLAEMMNSQEQLKLNYKQYIGEQVISESLSKIVETIGNPKQMLKKLCNRINDLVFEIERIYMENWEQEGLNQRTSHHQQLDDEYKCEDIVLVSGRWSKIKKDFYDKQSKKYNISKVPEIYDTIRHDLRKNSLIFNLIDEEIKQEVHHLAKTLAYFVVINEYGATDKERIQVGKDICLPLFEKILIDLMFWKEKTSDDKYWRQKNEEDVERHIRTRLYFTSASHIYSLTSLLTLGNNRYLLKKTPEEDARDVFNILYMGYLSHIEFRLYENLTMDQKDAGRFRLEISLSTEYKKTKKMKEFSLGGHGFSINEVSQFIQSFLPQKRSMSGSKEHFDKRKSID